MGHSPGIAATRRVVKMALTPLPDVLLATPYPVVVWEPTTCPDCLLPHLTTHLAYHLAYIMGQINYHR